MLWYKSWLETRWRFLLCLAGLVFCCGFFVFANGTGDGFRRLPSFAFTSRSARELLFRAHQGLVALFPIAAILLGMGGLLRERAANVSSFTLALPISRTRLVLSRIGVGVLETVILALAPWFTMLGILYFYLGQPVSFAYAWSLLLALLGGGLLIFAMAVLVSSVIEGEYTAPVVAFGLFVINIFVTVLIERLRPLNLLLFMRLQDYVDRQTWTIVHPLPWIGITSAFCGTVLLFAASITVIERQNF
jgi:ABC-2 type transport system permease protein